MKKKLLKKEKKGKGTKVTSTMLDPLEGIQNVI
jgi:hypothetical protein